MSPVSRGRKRKKKNGSGAQRTSHRDFPRPLVTDRSATGLDVLRGLAGRPERPAWFDVSSATVLGAGDVLLAAAGPRELEQRTAEVVGRELHRAVYDVRGGLWLDWWFAELVRAAAARVEPGGDTDVLAAVHRLLYGLASIGSPALSSSAITPLRRAAKALGERIPDWLRGVPQVSATGEVVRMRDAYGARYAVIAGFEHRGHRDPSVFLFDIDASGFVEVVGGGVHDDVEQAAQAWRTAVGDAGEGAVVEPVERSEDLMPLVHADVGDEMSLREPSRSTLDNWFRANRRIHDLAPALGRRGTPLPVAHSLYRDLDPTLMTGEFATWYAERHGGEPDPEVAEALAAEWMEGTLPESWFAAPPERVRFQYNLIGDWIPEDPVTRGVLAMMPEWVRWLGERAGLDERFHERALAVARAGVTQPIL